MSKLKDFCANLYKRYECMNRCDFDAEVGDNDAYVYLHWDSLQWGYINRRFCRNLAQVARFIRQRFPNVPIYTSYGPTWEVGDDIKDGDLMFLAVC
ncbi:MAG: hypothetical protein J6M41_08770 [Prevotella sp.]|nr:hypothetical protein [Prevotella sp.]